MTPTEDRLRRTLRAVADTADNPGNGWRTEVLPEPPTGPHRSRALAPMLLVVAMALGIGWLIGRQDAAPVASDAPAAVPTSTAAALGAATAGPSPSRDEATAGVPTATGDEVAVATCGDGDARSRDDAGATPAAPGDDEATATFAAQSAVGSSPGTVVLLTSGSTIVVCVDSSVTGAVEYQSSVLAAAPPAGDGITVYSLIGLTPFDLVGRIGGEVRTVTLMRSDGEAATAQVGDGWFYVRTGVGGGADRLRWSGDGFEHEARVDLLDPDTPAETCARSGADCVAQRVTSLAAEAAATASDFGSEWASDFLADGAVTDEEWVRAGEIFAACMQAHGVVVSTADASSYLVDEAARPTLGVPVCDTPYGYVAEAREYLDALTRVGGG